MGFEQMEMDQCEVRVEAIKGSWGLLLAGGRRGGTGGAAGGWGLLEGRTDSCFGRNAQESKLPIEDFRGSR